MGVKEPGVGRVERSMICGKGYLLGLKNSFKHLTWRHEPRNAESLQLCQLFLLLFIVFV